MLCVMAMGFGVCFGWSLSAPDTILLPDSLGPLRPPYHLAFGSSTDNIYVASESSDIIVVDGNTFERIKRINTGTPVGGALLVSQHNKLYCSHPQQGRIGIIDCATNTIVGSIPVGTRPTLLCYSSGSDKLYCGDATDRTVSVIDCATNGVLKVIPVGESLAAMQYDPTTSKVYVANYDAVRAISCSADSVVASIDEIEGAWSLCLNKRRQKLYVMRGHPYSYFADTVYVISTQVDSLIAEMACSSMDPSPSLACNEATDRLYAANDDNCEIREYDCVGDTLIRLGQRSFSTRAVGLFCDSVRNRLFCLLRSNYYNGELQILDCAPLTLISQAYLGREPSILEADPARCRIMSAEESAEHCVLTVFDSRNDTIEAIGAVPLHGWSQVMCHNPATGRLYDLWGSGLVGGLGVIDGQTNRVVGQGFLPRVGYEPTCSQTSNKVYFEVNRGPFAQERGLGVFDGSGDSLLKVIEMGRSGPSAFPYWCPYGDKVYCSTDAGIVVVDCATDSVVKAMPINDLVKWFEYLGNGHMLSFLREYLCLIDCKTDSIIVDSAIGSVFASAHTGDGEKLYLVRDGRLEVRSPSSLSLLKTVDWPSGSRAPTLVYSDTTRKLYWFSRGGYGDEDSVLAIDATSDTVTARMATSIPYRSACLGHTGRYVFCASNVDSTVRVYDTKVDSLVGTYRFLPAPSANPAIISNPEQSCVYVGGQDVILVFPDTPPGVEEAPSAKVRATRSGPTVIRGVLFLPQLLSPHSSLLSADGQKVLDLHTGANDVRALAPGVYFVKGPKTEDGRPGAVRKVVVAR